MIINIKLKASKKQIKALLKVTGNESAEKLADKVVVVRRWAQHLLTQQLNIMVEDVEADNDIPF